jgi:Protein ChrB, N-terminal
MGADGSASGWLLLLAQLPSKPSSTRVALWRRLRAIGATAMVNGAWVLPDTAAHQAFFAEMRESILGPGGTGFVLTVPDSSPDVHEAIVGRFRSDRGREYDEFDERCRAFLDEIGKETGAGKYTFAELEEGEQDLDKLARWLTKIHARDFFPDDRGQQSAALMARCRGALDGFSQAVYIAEGVQEIADDSIQPVSTENGRAGSGGANASSATSPR